MAHFDDMPTPFSLEQGKKELLRLEIRRWGWKFYRENKDLVLIKFLFWSYTVEDIRWLFELLYGPEV